MIETIRKALRISHEELDEEIKDTIQACYEDMDRVGIEVYDENKKIKENIEKMPLIIACQKLYARWQFNFENAADRYQKAYEGTRDGMSLCGEYKNVQ